MRDAIQGRYWIRVRRGDGVEYFEWREPMETEHSLKHLINSRTKEQTPLSEEYLSVVGHLIRKLARHHGKQLDEMQILIYLEGLRDIPIERIEIACGNALRTLKKMPMLADLRELATKQGLEAR